MVEQTAEGTIRRVDGTEKAPRFGQKLSHGGGLRFGKGITTMHGAEVGDEAKNVQTLGNNREAAGLKMSSDVSRWHV